MKPVRTWILLANAQKARIVLNKGPGKGLFQLEDRVFVPEETKEYADKQGRTFNSVSPMRHKMEPNNSTDANLNKHINGVISWLEDSFDSDLFDRLIISASPHTLGEIRKRVPDRLKSVLMAEIPKDLTGVPTDDLPTYFAEVLAV